MRLLSGPGKEVKTSLKTLLSGPGKEVKTS